MTISRQASSFCKERPASGRRRRAERGRRLFFETLEDRRVLAAFAETGSILHLTLDSSNENVAIVSNGTSYTFTASNNWTGTNSPNVTGHGTPTLTVTAAGLTALTGIEIADAPGVAGASVTFNPSSANAYSHSLSIALDEPDAGTIAFHGASSFTGVNSLHASTTRNIVFASGSSLSSGAGDITLLANGQAVATSGDFAGIDLANATISSSTGAIALAGRGGTESTDNHGVHVRSGTVVGAGTTGAVTVTGSGGANNGIFNFGVRVLNTGSMITSGGGDVTVVGSGGTNTDGYNWGVSVQAAGQITAGGSGTVTVEGTGGTSSAGSSNYGVNVASSGAAITSSGGDVHVVGTAGSSSGGSNYGVHVQSTGMITAGGSGDVTVTGTGGAGAGSTNLGVSLFDSGAITSSGGNVSVTAQGMANSHAIRLEKSAAISSGNNASVTVIADSLTFTGTPLGIIDAGSGVATLRPRTAGTLINLGGADVLAGSPLTLGLTNAELGRITAGTLNIGDSDSGTITVSASIQQFGKNFHLRTGGGATGTGAIANGSATATTLTIEQAGNSTYSGQIGGPPEGTSNDKNLALVKAGAGKLTLAAANTYTGLTTVNAGILEVTHASALGSTAAGTVVADGATLQVALPSYGTISEPLTLSGTGHNNLGALRTLKSAAWNGAVSLAAPATIVQADQSFSIDGTINNNGYDLTYNQNAVSSHSGQIYGVISGAGGLTKEGQWQLNLGGANTYAGTTTVKAGILSVSWDGRLGDLTGGTVVEDGGSLSVGPTNYSFTEPLLLSGNGAPAYSGGALHGSSNTLIASAITLTGDARIAVYNNNSTMTISGPIGDGGNGYGLTLQGFSDPGRTLILSGANTYTGPTNINSGRLQVDGSLAAGTAVTVASGAMFDLNGTDQTVGSLAGAGSVALGSGTLTTGGNNSSTTFSGAISGSGGLVKQGSGTLTLSGANTYTGTTAVNAGGLTLSGGAAIDDSGAVILANAAGVTLTLTSDETIGSLAGGGALGGTVNLGSRMLVTGGNNQSTTFAGSISSSGGATNLRKLGTGTFALAGTNTYTGSTQIGAGILRVAGGNALADTGSVQPYGTGVLDLDGSSETIGSLFGSAGGVTLGSGGHLTITPGGGSSSYDGPISGDGQVTIAAGAAATFALRGTNTYTGPTTVASGTFRVRNGNALADTGAVHVHAGATFELDGHHETIGCPVRRGGQHRQVELPHADDRRCRATTTFAGTVTGTGSLHKQEPGALTLSGTNTYTGATTVAAGTLLVNGSTSAGQRRRPSTAAPRLAEPVHGGRSR
jgi:fibronectin-binding autotransporter adhesin